MSTKIKLKRFGKKLNPFYRVVIADSRKARNGKSIEEIGVYHPTRQPSVIEIDSERAQYWLSVGAQPTETVQKLLVLTGDWGKFKGDATASSTVKPQVAKADPSALIAAAATKAEEVKVAKAQALAAKIAAQQEAEAAKEAEAAAPAADAEAPAAVEESAADAAPAEESAADAAPAEEVAPAEAPAEEAPAAEEVPAEEAPAAEAPAPEGE